MLINADTFIVNNKIATNDKKLILYFTASWCVPCKQMSPIMLEVANSNPNIDILRIDVDESPDLQSMYNVKSVPALVGVSDGVVQIRRVGMLSKSMVENEIIKEL